MTKTPTPKPSPLAALIARRKARVAVMGLGYVGLPLALEFAQAGFPVTGFDLDAAKIALLKKGKSYIQDVPVDAVAPLVSSGRFTATTDPSVLSKADVVIICVPTPLRKSKDPDISYIVSAAEILCRRFHKGQLVVLESTTYPGTTREILLPRLEQKGLKLGRDFHLAFSPERVDPGNRTFRIANTPKIVGGMTPACLAVARDLYAAVVKTVVPVSSPETAEMAKLFENTFRAVNIALANEVALMCDRLKLDAWEVIDAAATKPFGFMAFHPGPGIGGHCIPLDPQYLSWKLKTLNFNSRFIELADEINAHMPDQVARKVSDALNGRGRALKGARVLVLGVTYKKDVSDVRESPAIHVIDRLVDGGARVSFHDPYVKKLTTETASFTSQPLTPAALRRQDCVLIVTNHGCFDMKAIVAASRLVVDCRNACGALKSPKVVKL